MGLFQQLLASITVRANRLHPFSAACGAPDRDPQIAGTGHCPGSGFAAWLCGLVLLACMAPALAATTVPSPRLDYCWKNGTSVINSNADIYGDRHLVGNCFSTVNEFYDAMVSTIQLNYNAAYPAGRSYRCEFGACYGVIYTTFSSFSKQAYGELYGQGQYNNCLEPASPAAANGHGYCGLKRTDTTTGSDGSVQVTNTHDFELHAFISASCQDSRLIRTGTNMTAGACSNIVDSYPGLQECPACAGRLSGGNSIYPMTGAKREFVATGLGIGGQPLYLTYDTLRQMTAKADGLASAAELKDLPSFGPLWSSSFHRRLNVKSGNVGIDAYRGDGRIVGFGLSAPLGSGGTYVSNAGVNDTVAVIAGGYRYIDSASGVVETYNGAGQLTTAADRQGNTLTYTYSTVASPTAPAAGYLTQVTDNMGRFIRFSYFLPAGGAATSDGLISAVTALDGRSISAAYDANKNLTALTWPDGKTRTFQYENAGLPWALTGKADENNVRQATWAYDTGGRAISSDGVLGTDHYSAAYGTPPQAVVTETLVVGNGLNYANTYYRNHTWQAPTGLQVTDATGTTATANVVMPNSYPVLAGISQPAGSGSPAVSNASAYDARSNLLSHDSFQGERTCYAYDASNRETVRVEGLASTVACGSVLPSGSSLPAGSRKIETSWHPDWRLPIKISQPLLLTTTVYHGQPDPFTGNVPANCTTAAVLPNGKTKPLVCKQVEQATLSNGAPDPAAPGRARAFTYDEAGRLLSNADAGAYYADPGASGSEDLNFDKVSLLLHGDGANGSTAIVDSSPNPKIVTVVGGASIRTAQSKFGGSSLYFDGVDASDTSLTVPDSPDFHFPGAYTVEFWVRPSSFKAINTWLFGQILQTGLAPVRIDIAPSTGLVNVLGSLDNTAWLFTTGFTSTTALQIGTWSHVALADDGTNARLFINGVLQATHATWLKADSPTALRIGGGYASGDREVEGYMDDIRVTKGIARYTANFTPPARRFPDTSLPVGPSAVYAYYADTDFSVSGDPSFDKVSLLLHGDGANGSTAIADSSPNPKVVTVVGGARTSTAQSQFDGSSLYLDGVDASDTSITVPDSPDFHFPGAYTVEFWVRPSSFKAINTWLFGQILQTGLAPVRIDIAPSTGLVNVLGSLDNTAWLFTTGFTSTTALQIGTWSHVALADDGTNARLFINGVLQATHATWLKADSPTALRMGGGYASGDREVEGYMDDIRVTKGIARYTANFTPPAQAFLNTSPVIDPNAVGHTAGDLKSITNAAGHVTRFTLYDGMGRVKQMVDPKGVVTDTVYTPRGWTSSVTVTPPGGTARTTNYTYDNAGQMTGASLPDGTTLGYSYDAAHRLTGVTDAKGNSVTYTLDNAGNKTGEQVKDPSGNLQRNVTRVYDALNRVQQITGASN